MSTGVGLTAAGAGLAALHLLLGMRRIYGAGIASSATETVFSVEDDSPNRLRFDLERVMRTRYRIDAFQSTYFVIESFQELFDKTAPDFTPIYERLRALPEFAPGE